MNYSICKYGKIIIYNKHFVQLDKFLKGRFIIKEIRKPCKLVKCLLNNHEDPNSNLQAPYNKTGLRWVPEQWADGHRRILGAHWLGSSRQLKSSHFNEIPCLKKK